MLAPIVVFGYNRPNHLLRCLDALLTNPESSESSLHIFIDGPKSGVDRALVDQCVEIARSVRGFRTLDVIVNTENLGLARSIRTGVDSVFDDHDKIIVIEDDIVPANSALSFLNRGLDTYLSSDKVASIQLYQYPIKVELEEPVFLRGADCWGWATWKSRWEKVEFDPEKLLNQLSGVRNDFNLGGSARFYEMLQNLAVQSIDSWAICWHASMYLEDKLSLYPPKSLCLNIGSDGSGTHASSVDYFSVALGDSKEWLFPSEIEENLPYKKAMTYFYRRVRLKSKFDRIWHLGRSLNPIVRVKNR